LPSASVPPTWWPDASGRPYRPHQRDLPVLEIQEEIAARMPTSPEAARLAIPEGTPVFEVIRTYHTADGPLDVARFIIRADMAIFDYRFPITD
jgi:GntR family transcriptional regulator